MIFLVRHGEAAAGWGDHPDPGLSHLGKKQAEAVAVTLEALGARAAVSSPMLRCRETALPFEHRMGLVAKVAPEISEIDSPADVGDRTAWLRTLMAGEWTCGSDDFLGWRQAMLGFVTGLPDHTVVFSHFVAINALVGLIESDPRVVVFRPGHCSVTQVSRTPGALRIAEYGSESATRVL